MRTITVEVVGPDTLVCNPIFAGKSQEDHARRATGVFRPLTEHEWDRIERRVHNGRKLRRKPLGVRNAPRPVLEDGRYVDEAFTTCSPVTRAD